MDVLETLSENKIGYSPNVDQDTILEELVAQGKATFVTFEEHFCSTSKPLVKIAKDLDDSHVFFFPVYRPGFLKDKRVDWMPEDYWYSHFQLSSGDGYGKGSREIFQDYMNEFSTELFNLRDKHDIWIQSIGFAGQKPPTINGFEYHKYVILTKEK